MQDKNLVLIEALDIKFKGGPVLLVHPLDPRLWKASKITYIMNISR